MKFLVLLLGIFGATAASGEIPAETNPIDGRSGEWLRYDDGSAAWVAWQGQFRGVWFNLEDFVPGWSCGVDIERTEMWFYHESTYGWDTADFYCEIWNGENTGPSVRIDQVRLTAVHYAPVYAEYAIPLAVDNNFWAVVNTEFSSGGWPSSISDGQNSSVAHSFHSDSFLSWEPWTTPDGLSNYFISVLPQEWSLDAVTWGSLKAAF